MKLSRSIFPLVSLLSFSAHAQVVVTDHGPTAPTLGASDTGYLGTTENRWGWDADEGVTQTFTVPSAGTIQSIFIGYNAFDDGETITFDLSVNKVVVASGLVLNGDDFVGSSATDDNFGPDYWMEFDLSAENIPALAGLNSFTIRATANTGESWAFAPRYNISTSAYLDGDMSLDFSNTTGDLAFAVTVDTESSAPTELKVTGSSFDESGNLILDFTGAGDTSYEVMKSLGLTEESFASLSSALIVTTDGTGEGQATVPASEAAEAKAFFRLEERP